MIMYFALMDYIGIYFFVPWTCSICVRETCAPCFSLLAERLLHRALHILSGRAGPGFDLNYVHGSQLASVLDVQTDPDLLPRDAVAGPSRTAPHEGEAARQPWPQQPQHQGHPLAWWLAGFSQQLTAPWFWCNFKISV